MVAMKGGTQFCAAFTHSLVGENGQRLAPPLVVDKAIVLHYTLQASKISLSQKSIQVKTRIVKEPTGVLGSAGLGGSYGSATGDRALIDW